MSDRQNCIVQLSLLHATDMRSCCTVFGSTPYALLYACFNLKLSAAVAVSEA